MARKFTAKQAKELIAKHKRLLGELNSLSSSGEGYRRDAEFLARMLLSDNTLSNMQRDEIARGTKPTLSSDKLKKLMQNAYKFRKLKPVSESGSAMLDEYQNEIRRNIKRLSPGSSGLGWLFASGRKKSEAEEAFNYLSNLASGAYAAECAELSKRAAEIAASPAENAERDFEESRAVYKPIIREMLPEVIKSSGSVPEFESLINKHEELLKPLEQAQSNVEAARGNISQAVDRCMAREIMRVLEGVPVEELNRDKAGIKVKTLRDSGYNTVADLCRAGIPELERVKGISLEGAQIAKKLAEGFARETARTVKLRLSADDKSRETGELVRSVYAYKTRRESLREALELKKEYEPPINRAASALRKTANPLLWLFSSDDEKASAKDAYGYLSELINGGYAEKARSLTANLSPAAAPEASQAWRDFSENTVSYFNVIEEAVPGVLGNDDAVYGLPEELAVEISCEEILGEGLRCELRRYQEWGVKYILHQKRVLLGDEMGLGKTVQAIAAMVSLRNNGATHFVVVCPASVLANWCREVEKHSDLKVTRIHGASKLTSFESWKEKGGVAVTTYETAGVFDFEEDYRFELAVVDEAHYIKNPEAKRTVNVKKLCERADKLLFMTGTALENRVSEMIELIKILRPGVAAEVKKIAFMSSAPRFREMIAPVYYRRRREDVLTELPELIESKEWCDLGAEEERVYENAVLEKRFADARRVSWSVDDIEKSSKATRLSELISEAESEQRKVIVFSFFLDTIEKIGAMLGDKCIGPINGSVSPARRQEIVDEFDKAPAGSVLVAQIQSGGTGLNIQSASVVIICEPQFKPSIENQAVSRAYRMGQSRNVLVYRLLCEDTVDEKITALLEEKQAVFDAFADRSAVGEESLELDERTFGEIMNEEYERVSEKAKSKRPDV